MGTTRMTYDTTTTPGTPAHRVRIFREAVYRFAHDTPRGDDRTEDIFCDQRCATYHAIVRQQARAVAEAEAAEERYWRTREMAE